MKLYSPRILFPLTLLIGIVAGCSCSDDPPKPPQPTGLVAVNGDLYRCEMGSTGIDQPLEFGVNNSDGDYMPDQWVHFMLLEGNGDLSADSIKSGSDGLVTLEYNFSGSYGHATIRAIARNVDTTEVFLRADVLIPGDYGHGQYIMLDDTYGDVLDYNGTPVSLDVIPDVDIIVANYEATLGVVFVIYDTNGDGVIEDTSPIYSVLVVDSVYPQPPDNNTMSARYEGTTVDGIGIGSHWWNEIVPIYGIPDIIKIVNGDPFDSHEVTYSDLHLTFWCKRLDSTVYQVDIAEEFDDTLFEASPSKSTIDSLIKQIIQ